MTTGHMELLWSASRASRDTLIRNYSLYKLGNETLKVHEMSAKDDILAEFARRRKNQRSLRVRLWIEVETMEHENF